MPTEEEKPAVESAANAQPIGKRKRKQKRKLAAARAAKASPKKAKLSVSAEAEKQLLEKGAQAAKEYLQLWTLREQGGGWKFQTKRQVWILKHMYTKSTIDKKFFNNLVLPYVSTLQGGAKERVLMEAQGFLQQGRKKGPDDSDDEDYEAEEEEKEAKVESEEGEDEVTKQARRKRAEKIVAALSGGDEGSKEEEDDD